MRLPKLQRHKDKKGRYRGNYYVKFKGREVNFRTAVLDGPDGANARNLQLVRGERTSWDSEPDDFDKAVAQMESVPPPAAASSSPPAPAPAPAAAAPPAAVHPDAVIPPPPAPPVPLALPPISADAADEAAANAAAAAETVESDDAPGAAGAASSAPPPDVNLDELAELAVEGQVWCAAEYVRYKVWRGFATPQIADEGKKQLAAQWRKIAEYSGAAAMLPPWVTGLLIPGAILLTSTLTMARAFGDAAKEQRAAAQASPTKVDIPAAA